MKDKGFTLVELLATITILSILMVIAIPNVMSVLDKNKRTTYIEDAKKLATLAEYKYRSIPTIEKPTNSFCIVMRMSFLDQTELEKGPDNKEYDDKNSYVIIRYNAGEYEYYVSLVENKNPKRGVRLINTNKLVEEDAMMKYIYDGNKLKTPSEDNFLSANGLVNQSFSVYNDNSLVNICSQLYVY